MKSYIHTYDQFVIESAIASYGTYLNKNYKVEIINALLNSGALEKESHFVMESAAQHGLYNQLWEGTISDEFINENLNEKKFGEWIQDKAASAKEALKKGVEKGREAVVKTTANLLSSFSSFAGKIIQGIKAGLSKIWQFVKSKTDSAYKSVEKEVVEKGTKSLSGKGEELDKESKNMGEMVKGGIKWVTGGAVEGMAKDIKQAGSEDSSGEVKESLDISFYNVIIHESILQSINEYGKDFINEIIEFNQLFQTEESLNEEDLVHIPGISKLSKIVAKLPFIKQLHDVEHLVAKAANSGLERTAVFLNKVGACGGPYKFVIFGTIAGLFAGAKIKHKLGELLESNISEDDHGDHGIKHLAMKAGISGALLIIMVTMPGIGIVIKILKKVAEYYWYYSVAQVILALIKKGVDKVTDKDINSAIDDTEKSVHDEVKQSAEEGKEEKKDEE